MINTLYSLDALGSPAAFFLALLVGFGFGFALERAGFSSSRRLAGLFYFTDMAVVKVMFTALVTAMLGLSYMVAFGWIEMDRIFLMPTIYGAQIAGGLLFGVGFAMGAWCPGTAVAGMAAGRIDALVFLLGAIGGSILFNELFPLVRNLYTAGDQGAKMAYAALGMSRNAFVLALTLAAVAAFWLSEWAEKARTGRAPYLGTPFLKAFSLALAALAAGLFVLAPATAARAAMDKAGPCAMSESALLAAVEDALDHIEPEELADRLMAGDPGLLLADVRPAAEFDAFHIRGAINVPLKQLVETLEPYKNRRMIVLYSNGMTHPAQARDALARMGYTTVYLLTDGLNGFRERVLKPASLRAEPISAAQTSRINAWRRYFAGDGKAPETPAAAVLPPSLPTPPKLPGLVEPAWLAENMAGPGVRILDARAQPQYNTAHIPGSVRVSPEHFRGVIGGVSSMLLPADVLAMHMSLLGIKPSDTVVIVPGDRPEDATLVSMAFARLGHERYGILNGGFERWAAEKQPVGTDIPAIEPSDYPAGAKDVFTMDYRQVREHMGLKDTVIIDVRPEEFYAGRKVEEARGGHIPGALNRPYSEDVTKVGGVTLLKPANDLAGAYARLIPSRDTKVIVHCRTGHQASQTFFVLRNLLGYTNVSWYDAGWSEWAARPELPAETTP